MNPRTSALLLLIALPACGMEATTVVEFATPDTPESLTLEPAGTLLVSMALTGEVRRVDPRDGAQATVAVLPLGQCQPNPLPPFLAGIAVDPLGNAYVAANTCDPTLRGIWKLDAGTGEASLHARWDPNVGANGVAIHGEHIYIADSSSGDILAAPLAGGEAKVVFSDPLLAPTGVVLQGMMLPGSNGLQWFEDSLYVSNSSSGEIVRVPFDGGPITVHATMPMGCDDFAIDALGIILCGTDAFHSVVAIYPNGGYETVLDASGGLDGPTSLVFGPAWGDPTPGAGPYFTVYVGNAAFPMFEGSGHGPSLVAFDWPVAGAPR